MMIWIGCQKFSATVLLYWTELKNRGLTIAVDITEGTVTGWQTTDTDGSLLLNCIYNNFKYPNSWLIIRGCSILMFQFFFFRFYFSNIIIRRKYISSNYCKILRFLKNRKKKRTILFWWKTVALNLYWFEWITQHFA